MESNSTFFEKLRILQPLSKAFMAVGVLGVVATFLTRQQIILTWSAVSIGLGLALGFFREAFRPRVGHKHEHEVETKAELVRSESQTTKQRAAATVFATGLVLTLVSGVVVHRLLGRPLNPLRLLLLGFLSLIVINIILFCANLFTAMDKMRGAKNERELEQIMAPALQGEPRQLGVRVLDAFRLLTSLSAGITVGAAILSVLKLYGA